jgi:hypothetical protein
MAGAILALSQYDDAPYQRRSRPLLAQSQNSASHPPPAQASHGSGRAAVGARTKNIEIGTGVIDMRYENPLYMVEDAGSADLIRPPPAAGTANSAGGQNGARESKLRLRPALRLQPPEHVWATFARQEK